MPDVVFQISAAGILVFLILISSSYKNKRNYKNIIPITSQLQSLFVYTSLDKISFPRDKNCIIGLGMVLGWFVYALI